MDRSQLTAQRRSLVGRKVKRLRADGVIPANIFGEKLASSIAVGVKADEFQKVYSQAGETGLVDLAIDGKVHPVLISELQLNPVTDAIVHVDFHEVDLTQKVNATVPVELIGESPAEKSGLGTVVQQLSEIDVTALPTDLPEKFEIDLSTLLEVDQAVFVKDLKYDRSKVELDVDDEDIVVKVEPPQKEEEVVVAPTTIVEGEEVVAGSPEGTTEGEAQATPVEDTSKSKE